MYRACCLLCLSCFLYLFNCSLCSANEPAFLPHEQGPITWYINRASHTSRCKSSAAQHGLSWSWPLSHVALQLLTHLDTPSQNGNVQALCASRRRLWIGCGQGGQHEWGRCKSHELWQIGEKGTPWHFWEHKSRLTGVHKKSLSKNMKFAVTPWVLTPFCPFPSRWSSGLALRRCSPSGWWFVWGIH